MYVCRYHVSGGAHPRQRRKRSVQLTEAAALVHTYYTVHSLKDRALKSDTAHTVAGVQSA